jgi:hypothetical protein
MIASVQAHCIRICIQEMVLKCTLLSKNFNILLHWKIWQIYTIFTQGILHITPISQGLDTDGKYLNYYFKLLLSHVGYEGVYSLFRTLLLPFHLFSDLAVTISMVDICFHETWNEYHAIESNCVFLNFLLCRQILDNHIDASMTERKV